MNFTIIYFDFISISLSSLYFKDPSVFIFVGAEELSICNTNYISQTE